MWHVTQVPSLCDVSRCVLSLSSCVKPLRQCLHEYWYCFAPVWIPTWRFTSHFLLNCLPQWRHWCGLLLLWTQSLCDSKLPFWPKLLLHSEHVYGLSPVWTLLWMFRVVDWLNALSHTWHLCIFSPPWILLCCTSLYEVVNRLLQTLHSNGFCPKWLRLCTTRALLQYYLHNICHILCTCIYLCEDCCGYSDSAVKKNVSHTEHMNTAFLHCVLVYDHSNFFSL